MKRLKRLAISIVLMFALLNVSPVPVQAHTSSYCGHGVDGIVNKTVYWYYKNVTKRIDQHYVTIHKHRRQHYDWGWVIQHYDWKKCKLH